MNVIVVGCGRVGSELAYRLFQKGNHVTVVDSTAASFHNLPADFRGRTVEGEILNQDILHRAGIERAQALAAVTNNDSINAVVAHVAASVYHVPTVVARNYDPDSRPVHEAFGHQVISSSSWGAQRMEEMIYQTEIRTVFSAGNGEVDLVEFAVPQAWHGQTVEELFPETKCVLVALTHAGQAALVARPARLEAGDILHVAASTDCVEALRKRLAQAQEG